jgi:hypothetical protein
MSQSFATKMAGAVHEVLLARVHLQLGLGPETALAVGSASVVERLLVRFLLRQILAEI